MNIRILVSILFLVGTSLQACGTGCLKADDACTCTIPDIIKGYKLENGSAVKVSIDQCIVNDFEGSCLGCNSGYYVDLANNKCVAVEEAAKVENCEDYSNGTTCSACKSGFFLDGTACAAVDPLIPNCDTYSSAILCSSCSSGYLISTDNKSCVANPGDSNCVAYSYVSCAACSAGFVKVLNGYLTGLRAVDSSAGSLALAATVVSWSLSGDNVLAQTACETALASNCLSFDAGVNVCNACNAGYFITEAKLCEQYPEEPIANCQDYSSVTTCIRCIAGHYFKSSVCTAIPADSLKDNCTKYNNASSNITCVECSSNHYLSSNSCKERDKSKDNKIVNCATKSSTSDKCAACNTNFYLTDDGLECLSAHANCANYNSINSGGTLQCNKCEDGFYLKTNTAADADPKTECLAGEVDNCAQYQSGSATVCSTCKNGFIQESAACNASNSITDCTVYDATDKTACDKCTDTANFNFIIEKKCSPITAAVPNCKTHVGGTVGAPTCTVCNDGYELNGSNCEALTIANCLDQNGGDTCLQCKAGFAISRDDKSCLAPLSWLTDQCNTNATSAANSLDIKNVSCSICKEHAYPLDFQNQYVCVGTGDFVQYKAADQTANCIRYNSSYNCVQCDPSSSNKFLSSTNTCVDSCGDGAAGSYHLVKLNHSNTSDYEIDSFNVCDTGIADTDLIHAPDTVDHDGDTTIAVACVSSTHFPVVTAATATHTIYDPTGATEYPYSPSAWFKYPGLTCTPFGDETIDGTTVDATHANDNCEFYILATDNSGTADRFTCLRCKFGYSGTLGAHADGQLSGCASDNTFSSTQLYNIPTKWNLLYSAHKCNDNTKIPFVVYEGAASGTDVTFVKWVQWGLNPKAAAGPTYDFVHDDVTKDQKNIVCLVDAHTSFTNLPETDYKKVNNCALAFIDTAEKDPSNLTASSENYLQGCAACEPGYKATRTNGHDAVLSCAQIANCAGGNLVDGCDTCNSNYILKYDNNTVEVEEDDVCLNIPGSKLTILANCWAAAPDANTTTNAGDCVICKRGYTMNADKVCEQIVAANCQAGHFRVHGADTVAATNKGPLLYAQGYAAGCSQCESSYVAVGVDTEDVAKDRHYCVSSGWIQNNVDSITDEDTTRFIPHCKLYSTGTTSTGSNDYVCEECDTSYVIAGTGVNKSGAKCYPGTSLGNCEIASSATNCTKCVNNTFGLVSNSCVAGNIANCVAYNYTQNETSIKCTQCAPGFYKTTDNKCEQGLIPNCKIFSDNQPSQCQTCEDNHILTSVGSNNKYCYPIPDELNCSDMSYTNNVAGGKVTCTTCANQTTHLLAETGATENSTICINFVSIANCTSYDVSSTLSNSTFKCNGCAEGFFYDSDTNSCVERKNKPNKCTTYSVNSDECTACGSNSYLFNSNKECKDYPKGILGCSTYSDASTCTACKAKRYLNENACPLADPEIDNCSLYSSKTVCASCASNYVLVGNECKSANAQNCVTYQSVDACATCGPDDGLETASGVTSCVNKTKTGCAVVNDDAPYNCDLCNSGFYLDAGECKNPTTITNCLTYAGKETCEVCEKEYALATDKKSCTKEGTIGTLIPIECQQANVVVTPVCSRCGPGYWFNEDKCDKLCSGDGEDGCFTCDPKTPEKCFICQSGYHMEKEQVCKKDGSSGGGSGGTGTPISASNFGIFSIIVALLVFLR